MSNIKSIFKPNLTSDLLVEALHIYFSKFSIPSKYIEMGCGSGYITFKLNEHLKYSEVTLSDISDLAIERVKEELKFNSLSYKAVVSNLFQNIQDSDFDLIVSDVAAISEDLTSITNWYDGVSCDTGRDGLKLISDLLIKSKGYLSNKGSIVYPVLSLSNTSELRSLSDRLFSKTEVLVSKDWPYKFSNDKDINLLENLKDNGLISFKYVSGFHVFNTEVWLSSI